MSAGDAERWDRKWTGASPGAAASVLVEFAHLLPPAGDALDLACGLGSNAVLLAERGLRVQAWDVSPVAVEVVRGRLGDRGTARVVDLTEHPPAAQTFDVIVVTRYLERSLAPAIVEALRPGGLLFAQTWARERVTDRGPSRAEWRLAPGELLGLFAGLLPLLYRDEGRTGDLGAGFRDEAMLVARKPG